jgi:hypothetical protein
MAAGILMEVVGIGLLVYFVPDLIQGGVSDYGISYVHLVAVISALFFIPGGVFCLRRKYWKVCFASSLLLIVVSAYVTVILRIISPMFPPYHPTRWVVLIPAGILPIIFICVRRREWQKSQA